MCILVSASDHATAAPDAPAPMIRTSTGSFIPAASRCNSHGQRTDAADEIGIEPLRRPHDLEAKVPLQNFLPENPQLLLGEAITDTAMDAGAKRQMLTRLRAIDDEFVWSLDLVLVAIAGDVP